MIEKFIAIFAVLLENSLQKRKLFSAYWAHLQAFFEPMLHKTCDSLA
jgi:hypothetical protein